MEANRINPDFVERVRKVAAGGPPARPLDNDPTRPLRSLHLNEAPIPPSARTIAAMQEAAANLNRYPDHDGRLLVELIAERNGVKPETIVIGAGSNELLYASADLCLDAGDEAIAPVPGFPTYAKAPALRGAKHVGIATHADGSVDVDAMLAAVSDRTRLVYAVSPHNPTGVLMKGEEIERLATRLPPHILLHFDEAYYEFGRHAGGAEALAILKRRQGPWIITRSFSKAFGLAGVRVGYGLCSDAGVAEGYRRVRVSFSVNAVALAGARAAFEDEAYLTALLDTTAQERARMSEKLEALGYRVLPSAANFIAALIPRGQVNPAKFLQEHNILIGGFAMPDGRLAMRITIGTAEDTDALIDTLKALPK